MSMSGASRVCFSLALSVMVSMGAVSCGGGGGSDSTPTTPSDPVASIQGTWVGTATSQSASGTCLANGFRPLTVPAKWVFQQTGSTFTGQQTLNNVVTCPSRGTISGSTVTFFVDPSGPASCRTQTIVCSSAPQKPLRMDLYTDRVMQVGTLTGTRMSALGSSVWKVTDIQTGQVLGDFEVRGTQDLQKQ